MLTRSRLPLAVLAVGLAAALTAFLVFMLTGRSPDEPASGAEGVGAAPPDRHAELACTRVVDPDEQLLTLSGEWSEDQLTDWGTSALRAGRMAAQAETEVVRAAGQDVVDHVNAAGEFIPSRMVQLTWDLAVACVAEGFTDDEAMVAAAEASDPPR